MKYWLMKSEPSTYSIENLEKDKTTMWEGVRNYQARNFMRDDMKIGDMILFYHSNANPSGIAGIAEVCSKAYPDPTQFDPKSKYFDSKSKKENPIWFLVDIKFKQKFRKLIPLETLKQEKQLKDMVLTQKGSRLSVQPVKEKEFRHILNSLVN